MYIQSASIQILLFSTIIITCLAEVPRKPPISLSGKKDQKSAKLPPCKACTILVDSFKKGMDRTSRLKHDGGDAAWEEEKLGSYKTSELRLVEIQESLCNDITRGEDQCHHLAEEYESSIEEWWFKHQTEKPDFFSWLCIEQNKVCCPPNTYGPDCSPCSNCYGNGQCKGNGTRKGNGKCNCDTGYQNDDCMKCSDQYYEAFRDENKLLCSICHIACDDGGCTTGGTKGCRVCKKGWIMSPENGGCIDDDECATAKDNCKISQFCVNNEGSFSCLECDKSCVGCEGDGPDLCKKCADGYELRDGLCLVANDSSGEGDDSSEEDDSSESQKDEL